MRFGKAGGNCDPGLAHEVGSFALRVGFGRGGRGTGNAARETGALRTRSRLKGKKRLPRIPGTWRRSSNRSARTATDGIRSVLSPLRPTSKPANVLATLRR